MANTYHQLYIQAVFAVKYRAALIADTWRPLLQSVIGNLINETGCKTIVVNGVEDHMHCLIALKPVVSVSELMKTVKAKSSKYINDNMLTPRRFEWKAGYGVFSYSRQDLDTVFRYIQNQAAHHRTISLRKEYMNLLNEFGIDYNEQYIFEDLI